MEEIDDMLDRSQIMDGYKKYVMPTYTRTDLLIVRGEGSKVWDESGNEYLDFFPGWAVSGVGHCHPKVVQSIREQAGKLIHLPNNMYNLLQGELSERLIAASFDGKCFYANSGAEANEAAIKLAKKRGVAQGRFEIISMEQSFHGRTFATLTATGQPKYREGFGPLLPGFSYVPFGDIEALKGLVNKKTAAVLLEPVQGEGGINVGGAEYLKSVRKICDESGALMILDEVQTGIGRTGELFAWQNWGVVPDAFTLAKSLGGGMPIGAL
ncbi:MAG: aminotransferase class III-fold pyridoxal phosphate-dependent enzyme, partial [Candidatus Theseobacter exili]|nr:aminotransferase class III-fold pyridoxal phosphate-dependent enzyme [Candidatus Theseobacter exili]